MRSCLTYALISVHGSQLTHFNVTAHCKQNNKPFKNHTFTQWETWISFHPPTFLKETLAHRGCLILRWEERQSSRSRFGKWRLTKEPKTRQTLTSSSSQKDFSFMKTINWQGSPNFKNNDTFLSLAGSTTAYQSRQQCSSGKWVIAPSVPAAILLEITWNMNHVDLSFSFFPHTRTAVKRDPICFLGEHGKRSFEAVREDQKRKKKRQILLKFALVWNKKPICIRTKASLPHIKAVEGRSFVREKSHCSQSEAKTSKTSSILSPSQWNYFIPITSPPSAE